MKARRSIGVPSPIHLMPEAETRAEVGRRLRQRERERETALSLFRGARRFVSDP
jgi:hypothetical protein